MQAFPKLDTIASDWYLDRNLKKLPLMQHSRNHGNCVSQIKSELMAKHVIGGHWTA